MRLFVNHIALVAILLLGTPAAPVRSWPAASLSVGNWETAETIPGLLDSSPGQYPVFLVDQAGGLHVFHSQWVDDVFTIVYSRWIIGVGWSSPIDILMPPFSQARLYGAFLDDDNIVNLVLWGGDEIRASIYYMRAPLNQVEDSREWSAPLSIGPAAVPAPSVASVVGDGKGFVMVVYSGTREGVGLYSVYSTDEGSTWSQPSVLQLTRSSSLWPYDLRMILAGDGSVHAAWTINNVSGNSEAIYYARTGADPTFWEPARLFSKPLGPRSVTETPELIEYRGELFMIYHNDFPITRYMQRSADGGTTWSAPVRLFNHVGSNGAAALVVDAEDKLQMFFGNRISVGDQDIHGLWQSTWSGERWSQPEAIVSGPQIRTDETGIEGFDPSFAQALLVQGNILFVAWRHDPMAGPQNVWYAYRYLNAPARLPEAEPLVLPTPTAQPAASLAPEAAPTLATQAVQVPQLEDDEGFERTNPVLLIFLGIAPVVLIISAVFYFQRRKF